jgi:hypothetical protein
MVARSKVNGKDWIYDKTKGWMPEGKPHKIATYLGYIIGILTGILAIFGLAVAIKIVFVYLFNL